MDDYSYLGEAANKAVERSKKSSFERTNEFLAKVSIMEHLPNHEKFPKMSEIFRELLIRLTKAELRIAELEERTK